MLNLLNDSWLPARRADGAVETIRPDEITRLIASNPVVAIDWARADFRIACLELLIGLVATACPPHHDDAWDHAWKAPPSPEALAAAFAPIAHAFDLDGPGPRFLQDIEELPGEPDSPETLLIEAPGANTRRNNTALLVKPGRVAALSRAAAAMALFTLQCYAPSGGRGNLTSLRGGGPLTTLVLPPGQPRTLWHLIWANMPILRGGPVSPADLPQIFPWLAATRTADRYPATTPQTVHPLQAFWGMPRRIRLDFADNAEGRPCDLTGTVDPVIVTGWRQRPNGVRYVGWEHRLSPAYKDAKSGTWLPVHPQPGGIGYRHWVGLVFDTPNETRRPARAIADWRDGRAADAHANGEAGLLAAGYDIYNNMKARAFIESEMPLPGGDPVATAITAAVARHLVDAAGIAASALRLAVRQARYDKDTKLDSTALASVYESFWAATHDRFFELVLDGAALSWETALDERAQPWVGHVRRAALRLFDEAAPLDPTAVSSKPERIVAARLALLGTLSGRGKTGKALFEALELALPEPKAKRAQRPKGAKTR